MPELIKPFRDELDVYKPMGLTRLQTAQAYGRR